MSWRLGAAIAAVLLIVAVILHQQIYTLGVVTDYWLDGRPVGFAIVVALGTASGAIVAGVAAFMAVVQLRDQRTVARLTSARDTLWHFNQGWDKLESPRKRLNEEFKAGKFDPSAYSSDAHDILNFFDGLAYMANKGHITDHMTWNWFYDDAYAVWTELRTYVERERAEDPLSWIEIDSWLARLEKIEAEEQRRGSTREEPALSVATPPAVQTAQSDESRKREADLQPQSPDPQDGEERSGPATTQKADRRPRRRRSGPPRSS